MPARSAPPRRRSAPSAGWPRGPTTTPTSARATPSRPASTLAAASHGAGDDAALVRVDLLLGDDGAWRACEINADCPGGHNETLALPRIARDAGFTGGVDPTHVVDRLVARIAELARDRHGSAGAVGLVHATAYAEDLQICALLQRKLQDRGLTALLVSPTAPRLVGGELVAQGRPLRALYRYFPAEYMDGQENVADIVTALRTGAVRSITSFSHMCSQSKTSFARAWALERALDDETRAAVHRHLPETHDVDGVARVALIANRPDWVLKRALGRVGDQVLVGALHDAASWTRSEEDDLNEAFSA